MSDSACDALFDEFDVDGTGRIAHREYVRYSLREALAHSLSRVRDLFLKWDTDSGGKVERREFGIAFKELGFDAPKSEIDLLFEEVDKDKTGTITFNELHKVLRQTAVVLKGGKAMGPAMQGQPGQQQTQAQAGAGGRIPPGGAGGRTPRGAAGGAPGAAPAAMMMGAGARPRSAPSPPRGAGMASR